MNHTKLLEAVDFAAYKHRFQRRKDKEATPYINHPIRVAKILSEAGENNIDLLIAAVLHDTIEDTETTTDELKRQFGDVVCSLVLEVTDNKDLPKEERKRLQIINAPKKSERSKKLKYGDLICNLTDILDHPPHDWTNDRKIQYFEWSRQIGEGLGDVNLVLKELLRNLIQRANLTLV